MTSRGRDDTEGFLSRWSQRKQAVEQASVEPTEVPQALDGHREEGADHLPEPAAVDPTTGEATKVDPADLPDIDSLDADSDFTVFMDKGVPEAVTRRALRRLWRLDPVFGHLDGLNDYDLDYTDAATVVENLKTIYQVGKGMVLEDEDEEEGETEKTAAADGAEGEAAENVAAPDATPHLDDMPAESTAAPPVTETSAAEAVPRELRPRNPGDPVVTGSTTRRSAASRPAARSARSRRWGDSEG